MIPSIPDFLRDRVMVELDAHNEMDLRENLARCIPYFTG